jgi:RimJ/RimL family protein N-acetyltransferase
MNSHRVSLETLSERDERLYCELFTDPMTMRHIGAPLTPEIAKRRFRGALVSSRREPAAQALFSVSAGAAAHHIGICALQNIDRTRSRAEVGVMLRSRWHGKGFGTEALRLVLAIAFTTLALEEVWGQFDPSHVAVERMNVRAGMVHNGSWQDYEARPGMRIQRAIRSAFEKPDAQAPGV